MIQIPESKMKIRFPDCDPFNHLNNSKYIDYIINAREDHLVASYDFDIHKFAKANGAAWVVVQNQISYLVPAFLNETVTIQTQLLHAGDKSLNVEGVMWDESKSVLKSVMWTKLVHYDLRAKTSASHNAELQELFNKVVLPLETPVSFEERVAYLKAKSKSLAQTI
jgi:YbgC/YbaW family acyl-CoA thioester hydrolase